MLHLERVTANVPDASRPLTLAQNGLVITDRADSETQLMQQAGHIPNS
jgi:hypothetical protein